MKKFITLSVLFFSAISFSQTVSDSIPPTPQEQQNSIQRILSGTFGKAVTLGGYGEMVYNQPEGDNGTLDVHRLVLLLGYKFDEKTQFITEIEVEHVEEIYIEQAFVNYAVSNNVNLRGGLMLVPMGIINEYHEPTTFNGTDRPAVDHDIVPTTWRELGIGVTGRFPEISLGYQAYIFNGFKSTALDNEGGINGFLKGKDGLRGGRQKGIESTVDSPTFSAKLDYYGIPGLRFGLAGYFGKTQADDEVEDLDGANIGISMVGFDLRYAFRKFTARGEFVYASLTDTDQYNTLTGRDLGSTLMGYYVEGAYNLLPLTAKQKLFAFARYEQYDTHAGTEGGLVRNDAYNRQDITAGLSYHIANGVVIKGDYQIKDNALDGAEVKNQLNFGIGVWF
ncbi:hypothetical protein [Aequorivita antarctica]|uniref:Porin n=1 Tax=Aequorivita antarctica TaxID=153266 RepID=A0A5C6YWY9_9FLAO|nr:hypothetical protein [Aequorivita antarctica]TXD72164.1 hypothetical protein ESU54_14030 [Aequorivita antarctica]SRX75150.1 hypothetical protein AEQU3_02144 [Aequorivita antarctica]